MARRSQPALLVVEDDPAIREMVAELLRLDGYDVEEAYDGAAAIRALDDHRPASQHFCGILLDMMLPQVSGLAVLDHLRSDLDTHIPVVAMSASGLALEVARAAGAVAAIAKPFDIAELLAVVEQCCPPAFLADRQP